MELPQLPDLPDQNPPDGFQHQAELLPGQLPGVYEVPTDLIADTEDQTQVIRTDPGNAEDDDEIESI